MKEEKYFPISKYPEYNGTKIWIPEGYEGSVTNKLYRRFPNPEKQYSEYTIQNVSLDIHTGAKESDTYFKSDELGIICDLISNNGMSRTPGVYLTHEQIGTFVRNESKAMLGNSIYGIYDAETAEKIKLKGQQVLKELLEQRLKTKRNNV